MHKIVLFIFIASAILPSHAYSMDANTPHSVGIPKRPTLHFFTDNPKDEFLFKAIFAKDLFSVKQAIAQGAQIEARCLYTFLDQGKTPLAMACSNGSPYIAQHLISSGANCNACDDRGLSPLYHALQNIYTPHCVPVVEVLVHNGADVGIQKSQTDDTIVPEGSTPIHRIAEIMQYCRFGPRSDKTFDIQIAPEVFDRLQVLLTIIVKEIIHQAYRQGEPRSWENRLTRLFSQKNMCGKAAFQLFIQHEQFNARYQLRCFKPEASELRGLDIDELEYKLFMLLHPEQVWQYAHKPFCLEEEVRKERALLEGSQK